MSEVGEFQITEGPNRVLSRAASREEAAELSEQFRAHGIDVEIRHSGRLLAIYGEDVKILDGHVSPERAASAPAPGQPYEASAEQPYDSFQSPGLNQIIARAFGDTPGRAVYERRCVKEPIGCGQPLAGLCREEFGGERPCLLPEGHEQGHIDYDEYQGNMAALSQFHSQLDFTEWTHTGLCQACQDKMTAAAERAEASEASAE